MATTAAISEPSSTLEKPHADCAELSVPSSPPLLHPPKHDPQHHIDCCPIATANIIVVHPATHIIVSATPEAELLICGPSSSPLHSPSHSRRASTTSSFFSWTQPEVQSRLVGKSIYELIRPVPNAFPNPSEPPSGDSADTLTASTLQVVEVTWTDDFTPPVHPRRWAYACVHRFGTDVSEYNVWFLEDVTRVSSVFSTGFGGIVFPRRPRGDRRRKGINVDTHPRYQNEMNEIHSDDEGSWTAVITAFVPGLSHVVGGKRTRNKTEPVPLSRKREIQEASSGHLNGAASPIAMTPTGRFRPHGTGLEGARDFLLGVAERRVVAIASAFGLGKIPVWIFARLREVLAAPPSSLGPGVIPVDAVPSHSQIPAFPGADESGSGQPTIALQLNPFGRVHQAYPISPFLGMSTENLMNRFLMRFVYEEDIPQLCRGMSQAIREGRSLFYVRWDWRSRQELDAATSDDEENVTETQTDEASTRPASPLLPSPPSSPITTAIFEEKDSLPQRAPDPDIAPPNFNPGRRHSASEATHFPAEFLSTHTSPEKLPALQDIRLVWVQINAMIVDPTTDPGISPPDPLTLLALITALPSASGAYPTPTWVSDTTLGPIPSDHEFGPALPVSRAPLRTRSSPSLNVPDWSPSPPPVFIPRPLSLYSFIVQFRDSVMAVASRIVHMPDNGAVGSARVVAADMSLTPKSGALTPRHGGDINPTSPSMRTFYSGGAGWH